ncbi:Phosphatidylinositol mannoside acyltransferase [Actinomyces bovis]|uniref:Phosphatidylinositol mannoside acyltransferase n=1 Tax=Actinomyces bovis TaxID=1658 RepID=A0ABY1VR06_9ACTO|nr:phosphatidylinositol mannoside acyltransferase [Actinomyces bovis]SPT54096.1 Phosphatidylinositol mannoside acyltransferase [Actinomyces bovis]VEG53683.1 Phosphatidylinositol mannoside acyltransferase [Actinomyces israelii]
MRPPGVQDAYRLAWKYLGKLPTPVGRGLFNLGADATWAVQRLRGGEKGLGQLEKNLARVVPGLSNHQLHRLSRAAMRSYLRYFYEAFTLSRLTPQQLRHRLRPDLDPQLKTDLEASSVVIALPHMGNWDLTAAWAVKHLAPVLVVAEKLEPAELFEQFVAFREGLGLSIIGQAHGERVFEGLVRAATAAQARGEHQIIALLADRDLSASGVEVELCGHPARVAAGPAALANRLNFPLYTGTIHYERLSGQRRLQAGSSWGVVLTIRHVPRPTGLAGRQLVAEHTRAWIGELSPLLAAKAVDWHMLQAVFTADLDPARLARRHAQEETTAVQSRRDEAAAQPPREEER